MCHPLDVEKPNLWVSTTLFFIYLIMFVILIKFNHFNFLFIDIAYLKL